MKKLWFDLFRHDGFLGKRYGFGQVVPHPWYIKPIIWFRPGYQALRISQQEVFALQAQLAAKNAVIAQLEQEIWELRNPL